MLVYEYPLPNDVLQASLGAARRTPAPEISLSGGRGGSAFWQISDKRPEKKTQQLLPGGLIQIVF